MYRYPGNYARYLEMKEARIAADDADADRAKTKLRRESLWMAKQPRSVYLFQTHVSIPSSVLYSITTVIILSFYPNQSYQILSILFQSI